MYQGKHRAQQPQKPCRRPLKVIALAFVLLLALALSIGGVVAFLSDSTESVKNVFTPSQVKTEVVETFNNGTKSDVKIQNTGDTTAWIRAAVVVTWQDASGNIYGTTPVAGTDYTLTLASNTGWIAGRDGFYYYQTPVKSREEDATNCYTGVMIESCKMSENATVPDGYSLCVEVLCSGIQSVPANVFNEQWGSSGLEVSNNALVAKTGGNAE